MKKNVIFLICLISSIMAFGQNEKKDQVVSINEVEVTPPKFTGLKNVVSVVNGTETVSVYPYLAHNFMYPEDNGFNSEGTEVIEFTVSISGELSNFNVINSVSPEIDKEMIRVLKTTNGMWKSGSNNGKPVAMEHEVAIVIKTGETERSALMKDFTKKTKCLFKAGNDRLIAKGKPKKALKHYNEGIKLMPYEQGLFYMRGLCRYELGDVEGARQDWNRLKALGGIDNSVHFAENVKYLKGYPELADMLQKEEK